MRHVLASILQEGALGDPALDGAIVSVSEVQMSNDLRYATAYIMPIGASAEHQRQILATLQRETKKLRQMVAERVNIKYAADLRFRIDDSFAEGAKIDALLRSPRVAQDLGHEPGDDTEDL